MKVLTSFDKKQHEIIDLMIVIIHLPSPACLNQGSHFMIYSIWNIKPFTLKTNSCDNLQQ